MSYSTLSQLPPSQALYCPYYLYKVVSRDRSSSLIVSVCFGVVVVLPLLRARLFPDYPSRRHSRMHLEVTEKLVSTLLILLLGAS